MLGPRAEFVGIILGPRHAILEHIGQLAHDNRTEHNSSFIPLDSLLEHMLVIAWYPHCRFRLSFGAQDQVAGVLDTLNVAEEAAQFSKAEIRNLIRPD